MFWGMGTGGVAALDPRLMAGNPSGCRTSELVYVDGEEMLRSEAEEPFEDETPWDGTYDAQLVFPSGRCSIEIKIVSRQPEVMRSLVLADWEIATAG